MRPRSRRLLVPLVALLTSSAPLLAQGTQSVKEEHVRYPSGDISIAGTLYLPARPAAVPAIVMIHGSEGMPRGTPMYRESARYFASLGYAVLTWDKRGIGETPGEYLEGRPLQQSAADVIAGVDFLATRPEIRAEKIGVYGMSQGGWIGPLAATLSPRIAFVIAVSGPGVTVSESNLAQRANEWIEDGYTDADTAEIKRFLRVTWSYLGGGASYDEAVAARAVARERPWFRKLEFNDSTPKPASLSHPGYDYYRRGRYDPDSTLRKLRVPILAVFGEKDRHIPMPESATRFEASLAAARHPDYTVRVFAGAGHGINVIPPGEFERLRRTAGGGHGRHEFVPEFRPLLAAWLASRLGDT